MKKLITLILVCALCVGITTAGFAEKKLYLANQALDVEEQSEELEPEEESAPIEEEPVTTTSNANNNPGTGR